MYTSLPTLMMQRCAQAIDQVVMPHLTDPYVSMQAEFVARLLYILAPTVEEKGKELLKENEGMRDAFRKVVDVLRGENALSTNAVRNGLIKTIDIELQKPVTKDPDLSEENSGLKGVLVEIINGLEILRDDLSSEIMSSLRQQIRLLLRQQLNHELDRCSGVK